MDSNAAILGLVVIRDAPSGHGSSMRMQSVLQWSLFTLVGVAPGCDREVQPSGPELDLGPFLTANAFVASNHPFNQATFLVTTEPGAAIEASVRKVREGLESDGETGAVTTLRGTVGDSGELQLVFQPAPEALDETFRVEVLATQGDLRAKIPAAEFDVDWHPGVTAKADRRLGDAGRCKLVWEGPGTRAPDETTISTGDGRTFPLRLVGPSLKSVRFDGDMFESEVTTATADAYDARSETRKVELRTREVAIQLTAVDLKPRVRPADLPSSDGFGMLPIEAELDDGTKLVGQLGCEVGVQIDFAAFKDKPHRIALAGDAEPYAGKGALLFVGRSESRVYGDKDGPLRALRYIAITPHTPDRGFADCVLQNVTTGERWRVARVASDDRIEIYDRRTAKVVAKHKFRAPRPKCPAEATSTETVRSIVASDVLEAWIERWAQENLEPSATP